MNLLNNLINLLSPAESFEIIPYNFCRILEVPVTRSTLKKDLEEHPDHPSLLAISDVLKKYGIDNVAVKLKSSELNKLAAPFIAQVKIDGNEYFLIGDIKSDRIVYVHPITRKVINESTNDFDKLFTGVVLLGEKSENFGETNYKASKLREQAQTVGKIGAVLIFPLITIFACVAFSFNGDTATLLATAYLVLYLIGALTGVLLLWHEVDAHNPALQKICSVGKKVNCSAVLHSKASKVFGISWSAIGFTYFTGSLLSLLLVQINHLPTLSILSCLTVGALPYTIYSIYYQSKIARQWCILCLIIQCLFVLQFIAVWFGGWFLKVLDSNIVPFDMLRVFISFTIPALVVSILLPALRKAKESRAFKMELQRLKHNPLVFEALLIKQKFVTEPTEGIGITLGKADAKYRVIKVCNPYCGPCIAAHPVIEELIENNQDIQLQIIFNSYDNEHEPGAKPARHLLAIHDHGNAEEIKKALNDWYLPEKTDYPAFAVKYPLNGELDKQAGKMKAMRSWCDKTDITFTPTFFINGHQLPAIYSVHDLKYFLSV